MDKLNLNTTNERVMLECLIDASMETILRIQEEIIAVRRENFFKFKHLIVWCLHLNEEFLGIESTSFRSNCRETMRKCRTVSFRIAIRYYIIG